MGLNSTYDIARGNIIMIKPFLTIAEPYAILIHDEKQREFHSTNLFVSKSSSMKVANQSFG